MITNSVVSLVIHKPSPLQATNLGAFPGTHASIDYVTPTTPVCGKHRARAHSLSAFTACGMRRPSQPRQDAGTRGLLGLACNHNLRKGYECPYDGTFSGCQRDATSTNSCQ
nr:hypothetical protein CFP56_43897 [Quercus suber]